MRTTGVVLAGLAVALGGCEGPDALVDSLDQPIIAGMADTGDPAIMELIALDGNSSARCTATLVTPSVLLTAAHCVAETAGARYVVFPGNDDRNIMAKDVLATKAAVFDPKYGDPRQGHDLAVVVLAAPLAIKPVPINRASLEKAVGKNARYVGYGLSNGVNQTGSGIKRQATAPIAQINRSLILIAANPHGACSGDSGGPMLYDDGSGEAIIGVGSFVNDTTCRRDSFYQRVDTQLTWVDEQIQKYDPKGLPPAPPAIDGGVADASPATPDAARDTSPPDRAPPPVDVRASEPDTAAPRPRPEPRRDAAAPDVEPEMEPETAETISGSGAGCTCAVGAPGEGAGAGGIAAVGLALLALARRRRR